MLVQIDDDTHINPRNVMSVFRDPISQSTAGVSTLGCGLDATRVNHSMGLIVHKLCRDVLLIRIGSDHFINPFYVTKFVHERGLSEASCVRVHMVGNKFWHRVSGDSRIQRIHTFMPQAMAAAEGAKGEELLRIGRKYSELICGDWVTC